LFQDMQCRQQLFLQGLPAAWQQASLQAHSRCTEATYHRASALHAQHMCPTPCCRCLMHVLLVCHCPALP
jgi:hypothetical protein